MSSKKKSLVLVSGCLAGINCRYDGGNNANEEVVELVKQGKAIPVCPEQLGGMQTPREPAEIRVGRVMEKGGEDVTDKFKKGAMEALRLCKMCGCKKAILKDGSPSCGVNRIYDGTFGGVKIAGKGVFARLLEENGVEVEGK